MDELTELSILRNEIDAIDREITALFCKRLDIAAEIGRIKRTGKLPVTDESRESEILKVLSEISGDKAEAVCELYRTVFGISKKMQ